MNKLRPTSNSSSKNFAINNDQLIKNSKTTNVNILLNRVKLNKKNKIKKKIIILFYLISIISVFIYSVII